MALMHDAPACSPAHLAGQEHGRKELQNLLGLINSSISCNGGTTGVVHSAGGGESEAEHADKASTPASSAGTPLDHHQSASAAAPISSQSLVEVPFKAEDATHAGLLQALGAWQSSDGERLYVLFPKPAASLADMLRFDPAALGSDEAARLLLYQACQLPNPCNHLSLN
jgi:hypothetical protein